MGPTESELVSIIETKPGRKGLDRVTSSGNKERGDNKLIAWCPIHDEHPEDCWEDHNPTAHRAL
jgi:hypothetical protein